MCSNISKVVKSKGKIGKRQFYRRVASGVKSLLQVDACSSGKVNNLNSPNCKPHSDTNVPSCNYDISDEAFPENNFDNVFDIIEFTFESSDESIDQFFNLETSRTSQNIDCENSTNRTELITNLRKESVRHKIK